MKKKQLKVGIGDAGATANDFIDAWKRAEQGETGESEHRLHFENLEMLMKTLTAGRWVLLKSLRKEGPLSIRALANALGRDYKSLSVNSERYKVSLSQRGIQGDFPWHAASNPPCPPLPKGEMLFADKP